MGELSAPGFFCYTVTQSFQARLRTFAVRCGSFFQKEVLI